MGRTIRHECIVHEISQRKEWYKGTVLSIVSGTGGHLNAKYDVVYEGDDEAYEVDHLIQDYQCESLQFCDL